MPDILSSDEEQQLVALLAKLQPGLLPFDVFHQVARLCALPIIELVPVRTHNDTVEVLLLERAADDPIWPGKLHVPGTVIRSSDTIGSFDDAFSRLLTEELDGVATNPPVFVQNMLNRSNRGIEASQLYWVEVTGEPLVGKFYPANELRSTVVPSQLDFILSAIEAYNQTT